MPLYLFLIHEYSFSSLIVTILFIVHFILEMKIDQSVGITAIVNDQLLQRQYYTSKQHQYQLYNITNVPQLEQVLQSMLGVLYSNEQFDPNGVVNVTTRSSVNSNLASANSSQQNTSASPLYGVMLGKYNYFMGMRITTNSAVL